MKAKILYLMSENTGKILTRPIKDGRIMVGKKEFTIDKVRNPILIESGKFSKKPMNFYIVKHDMALPLNYDIDRQSFRQVISPENYGELARQGAIKQLLTAKGAEAGAMLMWLIIGGVMGTMLGILIGPQTGLI